MDASYRHFGMSLHASLWKEAQLPRNGHRAFRPPRSHLKRIRGHTASASRMLVRRVTTQALPKKKILELEEAAWTERLSQLAFTYPTHLRRRRFGMNVKGLSEVLFTVWDVFVTLITFVLDTPLSSKPMS